MGSYFLQSHNPAEIVTNLFSGLVMLSNCIIIICIIMFFVDISNQKQKVSIIFYMIRSRDQVRCPQIQEMLYTKGCHQALSQLCDSNYNPSSSRKRYSLFCLSRVFFCGYSQVSAF